MLLKIFSSLFESVEFFDILQDVGEEIFEETLERVIVVRVEEKLLQMALNNGSLFDLFSHFIQQRHEQLEPKHIADLVNQFCVRKVTEIIQKLYLLQKLVFESQNFVSYVIEVSPKKLLTHQIF